MPEKMEYHPLVSDLETVMSYGSLGVADCIVRHISDNPNVKKNIILINGMTIVRNCVKNIILVNGATIARNGVNDHKDAHAAKLMQMIEFDFDKLKHVIEMYAGNQKTYVIIYFHTNINNMLPESARKVMTDSRNMINSIATMIVNSDHLQANIPKKMFESDNVVGYVLHVVGSFAYKVLAKNIATIKGLTPKIWIISHQAVDFFLMDQFPQAEVILSHTGKILKRQDLPKKVFGDETIPFNRMTYKLFGDKDLVKAAVRNRPKALEALKTTNLKLRTEREIAVIAKSVLGLDQKTFNWLI